MIRVGFEPTPPEENSTWSCRLGPLEHLTDAAGWVISIFVIFLQLRHTHGRRGRPIHIYEQKNASGIVWYKDVMQSSHKAQGMFVTKAQRMFVTKAQRMFVTIPPPTSTEWVKDRAQGLHASWIASSQILYPHPSSLAHPLERVTLIVH